MCPIEECQGNMGNCQFCGQKEDCILLHILDELKQLKSSLVNSGVPVSS